jgi:hypothetical protein
LTDNLSIVKGSHTLKMGADVGFGRISSNPGAGGTAFGSFTFQNRFTGNSYGDFMLGLPTNTARATPTLNNLLYNTRYGLYIQDDWKVNSKLTLNYGLRYTLQTQTQERDGSFANFDFAKGSYVIRTENGQLPRLALPRLLAAYPYVESEKNGWGSNVITADHNNFGPRFGFAYRPFNDNKTVVRGGFGVFYNIIPVYIGIRQISLTNSPFQLTETYEAGVTPTLSLANPFPGAGALSPNPSIVAVNREIRNTSSMQFNFTLEREIFSNTGLRVSYVGNKGSRVPWYNYDRNMPLPRRWAPFSPTGRISRGRVLRRSTRTATRSRIRCRSRRSAASPRGCSCRRTSPGTRRWTTCRSLAVRRIRTTPLWTAAMAIPFVRAWPTFRRATNCRSSATTSCWAAGSWPGSASSVPARRSA